MACATLLVVGIGYASSLDVTTKKAGSGVVSVAACDPDGFSLRYTANSAGQLTQLSVLGIAPACAGGRLRFALIDGATSVGSGSATLPTSGFTGAVSLAISPARASTAVTATHVAIEGP